MRNECHIVQNLFICEVMNVANPLSHHGIIYPLMQELSPDIQYAGLWNDHRLPTHASIHKNDPSEFHAVWYTDFTLGTGFGSGLGFSGNPKLRYREEWEDIKSERCISNLNVFSST